MFLGELVHFIFMYDDIRIGMLLTSEQSFKDLFAEKLELLRVLECPPHFILHDPLDYGAFCTSRNIPSCTLDVYNGWDICTENSFKSIINNIIRGTKEVSYLRGD